MCIDEFIRIVDARGALDETFTVAMDLFEVQKIVHIFEQFLCFNIDINSTLWFFLTDTYIELPKFNHKNNI